VSGHSWGFLWVFKDRFEERPQTFLPSNALGGCHKAGLRRGCRHQRPPPLPEALALERTLFAICASYEDKREGTSAFLDKRKALFHGR